jgi:hypothetical protein
VVGSRHPEGKHSVYHFGGTRGTLLGLTLYEADVALGQLTFASTEELQAVTAKVPGFRSLVELFPEKYADHTKASRFSGPDSDLRVFLTPASVELSLSSDNASLTFRDTSFAVHFGQTGPAEVAFANSFQFHFHEIAQTDVGAPLARLVPYARAIAIFRWLRENNIPIIFGDLDGINLPKVHTPLFTPLRKQVRLQDIYPRHPTVFFDTFGPTRITLSDGRETAVHYEKGRVAGVLRYDGAKLTVYRDALGRPIAMRMGDYAIAFVEHNDAGLLCAKRVDLALGAGGASVLFRQDSEFYPISNPENVVASIVLRFAHGSSIQ